MSEEQLQTGTEAFAEGSLLEMNGGGKQPVNLPWGETRTFLEDHDEVILRAHCSKPGYPMLSLGECRGMVLPPLA